jgi:hypothetical protein
MMMKIPSRPTAGSWSPWTRFRGTMLGRPPRRDRPEAALQSTVEPADFAAVAASVDLPASQPSLSAELG